MAEVKIDIDSFKPNSHKYKMEQAEKKNVQKIVKGEVISKKPTLGKRFSDIFLSEDVDTVKGYIIFDVLIPAIKNMLADMFTEGINVLLFGSRGKRSGGGGQKTPYNSMSDTPFKSSGKYRESYKRSMRSYNDIILDSRDGAEEVIDNLMELIAVYHEATIADLYDLVGITSEFTDNKWGWVDLQNASVRRVREGYLLVLPKPILLD